MRYVLIFILISGCTSNKSGSNIFLTPESAVVLDIEKFQTIDSLEQAYCAHFDSAKNIRLYLPFDFERNQIDANSKYSIPVMGPMIRCTPALIRSDIMIHLDSAGQITDNGDEIVSLTEIDSLFRVNTFNYGYDPTLSDEPRDALISISLRSGMQLQEATPILRTIADAYESIITNVSQNLSLSIALDSIPLNIILYQYVEPPPMPSQEQIHIFIEEIEGEIELDLDSGSL